MRTFPNFRRGTELRTGSDVPFFAVLLPGGFWSSGNQGLSDLCAAGFWWRHRSSATRAARRAGFTEFTVVNADLFLTLENKAEWPVTEAPHEED